MLLWQFHFTQDSWVPHWTLKTLFWGKCIFPWTFGDNFPANSQDDVPQPHHKMHVQHSSIPPKGKLTDLTEREPLHYPECCWACTLPCPEGGAWSNDGVGSRTATSHSLVSYTILQPGNGPCSVKIAGFFLGACWSSAVLRQCCCLERCVEHLISH